MPVDHGADGAAGRRSRGTAAIHAAQTMPSRADRGGRQRDGGRHRYCAAASGDELSSSGASVPSPMRCASSRPERSGGREEIAPRARSARARRRSPGGRPVFAVDEVAVALAKRAEKRANRHWAIASAASGPQVRATEGTERSCRARSRRYAPRRRRASWKPRSRVIRPSGVDGRRRRGSHGRHSGGRPPNAGARAGHSRCYVDPMDM
jgi:hypothetical protein